MYALLTAQLVTPDVMLWSIPSVSFLDFRLFLINALNPSVSSRWSTLSPFLIAKQYITFLSIRIGREPSSLYSLNYPQLINTIVQELEAWASLPLSLFGRFHLFKMVSFTRLLYPLQTLPILLNHSI